MTTGLLDIAQIEFSLNVPVAIYVKGMYLNIKGYRKIIAISEDNL
jgi:hypothetical protein